MGIQTPQKIDAAPPEPEFDTLPIVYIF